MTWLFALGFALIIFGFILTFISAVMIFLAGLRFRGKTRGGGLIMIGPIPIIFGTDERTVKTLIILSIALIIIAFIFMLIPILM